MKLNLQAGMDDQGRLILPAEVVSQYGLKADSQVEIVEDGKGLFLQPPITHLRKVYIEVTNRCNLECRTCMRNIWDETLGQMSRLTFNRILESLRSFSPPPTIFFGGFGEPLAHPDILEMVAEAKALGSSVELITNATMLTSDMSCRLIETGLDILWVSIDGATPESYADIRLGAALPEVLANLKNFRDIRMENQLLTPEIGIVFVAMKRNIADLPTVLRLGSERDATHFLVTNVLPYSDEMKKEVLYSKALMDIVYQPPLSLPHLRLPKIDLYEIIREPLYRSLQDNGQIVSIGGGFLGAVSDRCPFIESGAMAISWDGNISPCLPLLHSHTHFLDERKRFSRCYTVGNVLQHDLTNLWNAPEHLAFRRRVQAFSFSHCIFCSGCELSLANEEDCRGNAFPTCGGCLWAQGIIQCP